MRVCVCVCIMIYFTCARFALPFFFCSLSTTHSISNSVSCHFCCCYFGLPSGLTFFNAVKCMELEIYFKENIINFTTLNSRSNDPYRIISINLFVINYLLQSSLAATNIRYFTHNIELRLFKNKKKTVPIDLTN